MMHATLLCRSWLKRVLRVKTSEGNYEVAYNGRGGWNGEAVYIDGQLAAHNPRLWFGPVLVFPLGHQLAAVEIRVWPWFAIRSFHLLVEDVILYGEGIRQPFLGAGWADIERQAEFSAKVLAEKIQQALTTTFDDRRLEAAAELVAKKIQEEMPSLPPEGPTKHGVRFRFRIDESFLGKPPIVILVGQLLEGTVRRGDRIVVPLRGGSYFIGPVTGILRGRLDEVSDSADAGETLKWLGVGVNRIGPHTVGDINTGVTTDAEPHAPADGGRDAGLS
jgi:hypothetical protein